MCSSGVTLDDNCSLGQAWGALLAVPQTSNPAGPQEWLTHTSCVGWPWLHPASQLGKGSLLDMKPVLAQRLALSRGPQSPSPESLKQWCASQQAQRAFRASPQRTAPAWCCRTGACARGPGSTSTGMPARHAACLSFFLLITPSYYPVTASSLSVRKSRRCRACMHRAISAIRLRAWLLGWQELIALSRRQAGMQVTAAIVTCGGLCPGLNDGEIFREWSLSRWGSMQPNPCLCTLWDNPEAPWPHRP